MLCTLHIPNSIEQLTQYRLGLQGKEEEECQEPSVEQFVVNEMKCSLSCLYVDHIQFTLDTFPFFT